MIDYMIMCSFFERPSSFFRLSFWLMDGWASSYAYYYLEFVCFCEGKIDPNRCWHKNAAALIYYIFCLVFPIFLIDKTVLVIVNSVSGTWRERNVVYILHIITSSSALKEMIKWLEKTPSFKLKCLGCSKRQMIDQWFIASVFISRLRTYIFGNDKLGEWYFGMNHFCFASMHCLHKKFA